MGTTTHVSAGRRRRQRLRRTLLLSTLVVATSTAGYATWHDDDPSPTSAGPRVAEPPTRGGIPAKAAKKTAATPRASPTSTTPKGNGANRFAPVVTDRIPAPTASLPLSAAVPGTTNMQPAAAAAFQRAFAGARAAGLTPEIRSAWRSEEWQQVLFDRAVGRYGSRGEAAKWVLPPVRSAHVKGYAIDVHPQSVAAWLEAHGAAYGVCRTYDNEWWHFEYLATATCPPRKPTAAG